MNMRTATVIKNRPNTSCNERGASRFIVTAPKYAPSAPPMPSQIARDQSTLSFNQYEMTPAVPTKITIAREVP